MVKSAPLSGRLNTSEMEEVIRTTLAMAFGGIMAVKSLVRGTSKTPLVTATVKEPHVAVNTTPTLNTKGNGIPQVLAAA